MTANERLEQVAKAARAATAATRRSADRTLRSALAGALRDVTLAVDAAWGTGPVGPFDGSTAMRAVHAMLGTTATSAARAAADALRQAQRRGERLAERSTGPVAPSAFVLPPPRTEVFAAIEAAARAALTTAGASTVTERSVRLVVFRRAMARELARRLPGLRRILVTLAARSLNDGASRGAMGAGWKRAIVATFDANTGADSVLIHGQVVGAGEPFWDEWNSQWYWMPPNRPFDREVVVPWNPEWGTPTRGPAAVVEAVESGSLDRATARQMLLRGRTEAEQGSSAQRRFARAFARIG